MTVSKENSFHFDLYLSLEKKASESLEVIVHLLTFIKGKEVLQTTPQSLIQLVFYTGWLEPSILHDTRENMLFLLCECALVKTI